MAVYIVGMPQNADDNVGHLGSWAELDMGVHQISSVDMSRGDYQMHYHNTPGPIMPGHGTYQRVQSGWYDGGAYCRMTPPTIDGPALGIALYGLWRGASVIMQDFNLRFEWRGGPGLGSRWRGSKFIIVHSRRQLDGEGGANDRPIMMSNNVNGMDNVSIRRPNTYSMAPSQGTTQGWGPGPYGDTRQPAGNLDYWPWSRQPFYITDSGDTGRYLDSPLIAGGEIVTVEMRCISVPFVDPVMGPRPRGLIAYRVYRRNGEVSESGIPWNWDAPVPLGAYLSEVQLLGCGQYNDAVPSHPDVWMDVGGVITVARGLNGWLGPRRSFLQV